ncbi:TetR/AcrR family transcriptional regulator [Nonomuraea sp. NPDC050153]|uniref:TetR/AcrR family transcriptional regulator n=1 Tax=Nonomuraea sp. NPDC050153 TaxID=3364359 RepID=UPI0037A1B969
MDLRLVKGEERRQAILRYAMDLASVHGLEGVTIGRLANDLQMSKSGIFNHFPTKEELQLAVIDTADHVFLDTVITPALQAEPGAPQAWRLWEARLECMRRRDVPGGCFTSMVAFEFHARPGPVRDAIARSHLAWLQLHEHVIDQARELGHFTADTDAWLLATELDALAMAANLNATLHNRHDTFSQARAVALTRLHQASTPAAPLLDEPERSS